MAANFFVRCAQQSDGAIPPSFLSFFNSCKCNDNARLHIQCAGTEDFSILFAIGCLVDCAKGEDRIHVAEEEDSTLISRFDFVRLSAPSAQRESSKEVVACFLVWNDFNLCTKFMRFFCNDHTNAVNSRFIMRWRFSFDEDF